MTIGEHTEVGLNEDVLDRLESVLSDHPISFAMIFGSAARSDFAEDSDIDIAVEFGDIRPTDDGYSEVYLRLLSDLDERMGRDIDVVDVHSLTPRFARAAFDTGVVIHGSEGTKVALENELATGTLSVDEARDRVSAAAEKLREGG